GIDRRVEVVAQCRAEGSFEALFDREQVERRRPYFLRVDPEQARQRLGLGVETLQPPLRLFEWAARCIEALTCRRMRGLGAYRRRLGFRDRALRRLDGVRERREVGSACLPFQVRKLALDLADLPLEPNEPFGMLAHGAFELVAPRREIGERAGEVAEGFFACGEGRLRRAPPPRNRA